MSTRRSKKFMILLIGMFVSVALNAAWASSPPKIINLKIANYFPVLAKQSTLLAEFAKELEERSGSRVKTAYYPSIELLNLGDEINAF